MTRYAESTTVSSDTSRAEIERTLTRYGADQFMTRIVVEERGFETPCWVWKGPHHELGYGLLHFEGRRFYAHRVSHILFKGPIAPGLTIDHLCRQHPCVNPDHLEAVTRGENVLRGHHAKVLAHHRGCCVKGHPMDDENTYTSPKGQRQCRSCRRVRQREQARARRARGKLPSPGATA